MYNAGEVTVTGEPITVFDAHRRVYRKVYPVLVFAYADTPARRGWLLTCGASGRSGCDKCGIRGVRTLSDGTALTATRFLGYLEITAFIQFVTRSVNGSAKWVSFVQ